MALLKRYWFEFEITEGDFPKLGYWPAREGIGVTAYDYDDALKLLHKWLAEGREIPVISRVVENVDLSELFPWGTRQRHLIGCPVWRGLWYPAVNLWHGPDLDF